MVAEASERCGGDAATAAHLGSVGMRLDGRDEGRGTGTGAGVGMDAGDVAAPLERRRAAWAAG